VYLIPRAEYAGHQTLEQRRRIDSMGDIGAYRECQIKETGYWLLGNYDNNYTGTTFKKPNAYGNISDRSRKGLEREADFIFERILANVR
jgi:hypothetical protein